ncbi:trichohyalin (plasmid) [Thermovibrio ammonificans HB-1]|uniref:Trichohyalin n=1 Tax=Thermovibrio ammonificans (strain DSM 15698 / JCM 12110 / HB-1) TaxID=648996 RepID=E8T709_THEA1|nr:hypothetical protein [Thermovibrio ammonificans]ADU97730.1 trichohyalin [Thermovibrio ammonificans HB-1]
MEGKSRIAVSEIVKVLTESGAVKSRTTAYDWIEKETVGFGRVVEEGQKYWEGDFSKLFNWLRNKLGEKEVVREIVENGVPLSKYEELVKELRRLEREVAEKEASLKILGERVALKEQEKKALEEEKRRLKQEVEKLLKELKEKEKTVRELERKLKLKELEPIVGELPAEKRKALLKLLEELQ